MDLPFSFYAVAICAIILTGISKSGFGGGLGVVSVPLMSIFVEPQIAAAVLMPILLGMDVMIVHHYRKSWDRRVFLSLVPGALLGLTLGALTFNLMDGAVIRFAIGIMAVIFVVQFLVQRRNGSSVRRPGALAGGILGTVSGYASFIAHAGGPPVKGYLLRQNLDKTVFVGTNTMFFFTLNAIKTVAYGAFGTMNIESLTASVILAPFLFVGVFIGTRLHKIVDQKVFVFIVYGFLALTGTKLLSDSIPVLLGSG